MRDLLPAFLLHLKSQNRSARTMTTYEAILVLFSDATTARTPSRIDVEAFLARPCLGGRHRAPATRNLDLAALRAFAKLAVRELGWTTNPTDGIPFVRDAARDPAVLTAPELRRLFSIAAEASRPGERSRNLALLAVLGQLGLRVHELVHLDVEQLDFASATLVGVRGKGGTVHDLPLNTPTVAFLTRWLAERGSIALADEPALFVSSRGTRLSVRAIQRLMLALRARTGSAKRITPHTLRHSTATLALTTGSDLSTVAELLRHSDLNTTRRYLHLVDERRREAVRRLAVAIPPELVPKTAPATEAAAEQAVAPVVPLGRPGGDESLTYKTTWATLLPQNIACPGPGTTAESTCQLAPRQASRRARPVGRRVDLGEEDDGTTLDARDARGGGGVLGRRDEGLVNALDELSECWNGGAVRQADEPQLRGQLRGLLDPNDGKVLERELDDVSESRRPEQRRVRGQRSLGRGGLLRVREDPESRERSRVHIQEGRHDRPHGRHACVVRGWGEIALLRRDVGREGLAVIGTSQSPARRRAS
jgi:integrase/recombinase XerC